MDFKKVTINNNFYIKENKKPLDISTWAQYWFKDGKIHTNQTMSEEEKKIKEIEEIDNAMKNISHSIRINRNNYIMKYNELHGEGAYERLYYLEKIYDEVELEFEDEIIDEFDELDGIKLDD